MLRKVSIALVASAAILVSVPFAQASTSVALSSESSDSLGSIPNDLIGGLAGYFNKDLTEEQRDAIRFGPTTAQEAEQCLAKYGLGGEGPWPTIAVYPNCSFETIEQDFYDQAVAETLAAIGIGSS
ncbi:hypothetical protein H2C43_04735 [Corynebacterium glutamicum]|uniref:DUF732 domain-containing protein n=1 Tax=Corynebacterium glutamicum (strain ATCC 13032 / DSM 20300 / JCM 1318 / BCRC 11384 / CCUG 27702 / LMG 3730 / NBRC 12168 / NCIMB 10025 / NRRL B-2784 / 534) TaxID=196627 RepID=Q8NPU6_CORGL|nr:hypothetical protein [Corynebacterium glutamicum]ARV64170.1 hypothetical protein B7P23_04285 [Corynebacterium glutamicum]AUI01205.1 hypothetical protein CYL77_08695 [Corynebacterium glutamicum]AUI04855.1 hypothetical protein C0I99_12395 [Corynebacterium glutamicum]MBA4570300.1 hypothetical protein [Corynebacterium glutamicum]MBA4572256.1 hypothetical protein [Corynebacterium glutamicum]